VLVVLAHTYGALRLQRNFNGPLVTVATVTTDVHMGPQGLPSNKQIAEGTEQLLARTVEALSRGATLVVWNEGSTAIDKRGEEAFIARAQALAQEYHADIVVAYVVPLDGMRRFENKYAWVTPDGVLERYLKRHPVPGEGSVKGTDPVRVLGRPWGKAAGAICYDFPQLALTHAMLGADIVAVPASDWRGIDPFHTQMAAVRGIEGGFSVVRSVRWATSGAFDALGRPQQRGEQRVGIMDEIPGVAQESIDGVGEIASDLLRPLSVWIDTYACDLNCSSLEFHHEQDRVADGATTPR